MKNLAMHILDIFQNSIRANATCISITIDEEQQENLLCMTILDNGKGMDPEMLAKVTDPFYTTRNTRRVGLGLPLLKQNAERSGGEFSISSEPGKGTMVKATFTLDHLDRPSHGDLTGVLILSVTSNPSVDFIYQHTRNGQSYRFSSSEIKEALGGLSLDAPELYGILHDMVAGNLHDIGVN